MDEVDDAVIPRPLLVEPLVIVHLVVDFLGQAHKIDKVTLL